jgi:GDP-4-dehydro-6-deoxy-D-mannose reductase
MLPYRSVLITGASGFVGGHLLKALRARLSPEAAVHRADRTGSRPVDILDADALRAFVADARPDLVFHLAAQASVGQSASAGADTWRVNLCGTVNLAEAIAAEAPTATVAFASSSEVYGAAFNSGTMDEDATPIPQSPYARSKLAAEWAIRDALSPENRLLVFRPTNHSGPGQDTRFVLPAFAEQIAAIEAGRQPPVIKVGSLTAERDFLDVRDVVEAYLDAVAAPATAAHETFNIASGRLVPVGRLLDELLAMTTADIAVEQDPARLRPSDIPRAAVDATRLRSRTGWSPRRSLRQMIADVLDDRRGAMASFSRNGNGAWLSAGGDRR